MPTFFYRLSATSLNVHSYFESGLARPKVNFVSSAKRRTLLPCGSTFCYRDGTFVFEDNKPDGIHLMSGNDGHIWRRRGLWLLRLSRGHGLRSEISARRQNKPDNVLDPSPRNRASQETNGPRRECSRGWNGRSPGRSSCGCFKIVASKSTPSSKRSR